MIELRHPVTDRDALTALIERQLLKGRAFLPYIEGAQPLSRCALLLEFEARTFRLEAEIVYVRAEEPGRGVGLQLAALTDDAVAQLRAFLDPPAASVLEPPLVEPLVFEGLELDGAPALPPLEFDGVGREPDEGDDDESRRRADDLRAGAPRLHERLRTISGPEQRRLASSGNLQERVMLERMYGPNVWESLLGNSKLTLPEVATIARKGTLPKPLVELIASNGGWLASGEVQRALLSNPRSSAGVVSKVLRALSKSDLARVPQQTAYPMSVRQAAKNMLKG